MKNWHRIWLLLYMSVWLLPGCGAEDTLSKEEMIQSTEAKIEKPQTETEDETILKFVDAWGGWYTFKVNENVEKHTYDWSCLQNDSGGIHYEDDGRYAIRNGIDVSHHQGVIDWEKVKAAGYDFAFIRIGYRGYGESGSLNLDSRFQENLENARKAGIDIGIYFFSQAVSEEEAVEEADFVIEHLDGNSLDLPIVYDPELIRDEEARTDDVTGEQFTKNTIAFCEKIKTAGYLPMIYSNMYWEAFLYDLEQLKDYPIWYADYEKVPQTPYRFTFWQYSESGRVDGIEGVVDLNVEFLQ